MQVGLAVDHGDDHAEEAADHHAGEQEEEGGFRGGGGWGAGALRGARVPAPDWPTGRTGSAGCTKAPSLQSAPRQQGTRHTKKNSFKKAIEFDIINFTDRPFSTYNENTLEYLFKTRS